MILPPMVYNILGYIAVFILTVIALNWRTNGYLLKYMSVFSSRGKKKLLRIYTNHDAYYRISKVIENSLRYKDREGNYRKIPNIPKDAVNKIDGIDIVFINEENNSVYVIEGDKVVEFDTYDAVKMDTMISRAYMLGQMEQNKNLIFFIFMVVIFIALLNFYVIYKVNQIPAVVNSLGERLINYSISTQQVVIP